MKPSHKPLSQTERVPNERTYSGLMLCSPNPNAFGQRVACIIRTPIVRFEIRRARGPAVQHLTLRQNWPTEESEVRLYPARLARSLEIHIRRLLADEWTLDVLPALRRRNFDDRQVFAVQVLHSKGQGPLVRFNQEIRCRPSLLLEREAAARLSNPEATVKRGFPCSPEDLRQLLAATSYVEDIQLLQDEQYRFGHFTCLRIGGLWQGLLDLFGLLPQSVQRTIIDWDHSSFGRLIIQSCYGDDDANAELLGQLGIDTSCLPKPLTREPSKFVFKHVFQSYDDVPVTQMVNAIADGFEQEINSECCSLTWDEFPNYPDRLDVSAEQASEWKEETEKWFSLAGLDKKERTIIGLEAILTLRSDFEKWTRKQRAEYLNMSLKNYEKRLKCARRKLEVARREPIPRRYKLLLDAIFQAG